jgi:signal transduction histidine kinase
MKTRRLILILESLTVAVVVGIIVWQVNILPDLRFQIESGLRYSLERIAKEVANDFSSDYKKEALQGGYFFVRNVDSRLFSEQNLDQLKPSFKVLAGSQPFAQSWLLAFPDTVKNRINCWEYKYSSRFRSQEDELGVWRGETDVGKVVSEELNLMASQYASLEEFGEKHWENSLDSTMTFVYRREFSSSPVMGLPVFDDETNALKGFVFTLVKVHYLENYFIPNYFGRRYWQDGSKREGLRKRHVRFGLTSGQGDQLIYNSVAFGPRDFEFRVSVPGKHATVLNLRLGIGIRNTTVEEVAQSIYLRNLLLIFSLLAVLVVMLFLIFRTVQKSLRLSRLKSDFIANVSHEIKTPIASIKLAYDTLRLKRARTEAQQETIVKIIGDEANRLEYLVRTILDFSQLETGKKKYRKDSISLLMVSAAMEKVAKRKAEVAGFELEFTGTDLVDTLQADLNALEQVLIILLDNAIKYSTDKKLIKAGVEKKGDEAVIWVQDFGKGIAKEDQRIIFDHFVRLSSPDVHDVKGYGIGLSIAKAIVKDHEGSLSLKSKLGEGSTFFVKLPV